MKTASASATLTTIPAAKLSSTSRARPRHSRRRTPLPVIGSALAIALPWFVEFEPVDGFVQRWRAPATRHRWNALRARIAAKAGLKRGNSAKKNGKPVADAAAPDGGDLISDTIAPWALLTTVNRLLATDAPYRHRRGRTRDPRQLHGGAAPPRLRGDGVCEPAGRAGGVPHAAAGPCAGRHRPGRRHGWRLHADARAARAVGHRAHHFPVGPRFGLRHRRRAAAGRRRLPDQGC